MRRTLILIVTFQLLTSCSEAPVVQQPANTEAPSDFPTEPFDGAAGARFTVIPSESMLQVRVFRGGRLARLGHNHVISSRFLEGEVLLADQLAESRASLYLPITSMVVDDPQLRQEAGAGFEYPLSEQDRESTRTNMLGERQLNVTSHPYIYIEVLGIDESAPGLTARLQLTVLGGQVNKTVPLEFSTTGCALSVHSNFELKHAEIGLEAFSVLGGALQVQDPLQVTVDVLAKSQALGCTG